MHPGPTPDIVVRAAMQFGLDPRQLRALPGASRQTWRLGDHILRVRPRLALVKELAAVAAAQTVLPVPQVLATADLGNMSAALFEMLPGLPAGSVEKCTASEARRRGLECARVHRRIASVTAPEVLSTADPTGRAGATTATATSLLHLDLHPFNVLMEDGQLSGVIDWANAARGDPDLDRARTLSILTLDPAARRRRADPRWEALTQGWLEGGALTHVPRGARAWAYRYTLDDLKQRYSDAQLVHFRDALTEIDALA